MFNALSTIHAVLGPRRQLTATSLGNATGTVGVELAVGSDVADGGGVCVEVAVDRACVADGVMRARVGVSVTGKFDGRLQPLIIRTRTSTINRLRDFIAFLLFVVPIILNRNLADGNSSSGSIKKSLMCIYQGFRYHLVVTPVYFMTG